MPVRRLRTNEFNIVFSFFVRANPFHFGLHVSLTCRAYVLDEPRLDALSSMRLACDANVLYGKPIVTSTTLVEAHHDLSFLPCCTMASSLNGSACYPILNPSAPPSVVPVAIPCIAMWVKYWLRLFLFPPLVSSHHSC